VKYHLLKKAMLRARCEEATRRWEEETGKKLPEEKPLFFGSGRGRAFGRRPIGMTSAPQPCPKPESRDEEAKQD
jgi:hypothetical protein